MAVLRNYKSSFLKLESKRKGDNMLQHCIQRNHATFYLQFGSKPFAHWLIEKLRGCLCRQIATNLKPMRPICSFARNFVTIFMCISGWVWCHHHVLVFNFVTYIVRSSFTAKLKPCRISLRRLHNPLNR